MPTRDRCVPVNIVRDDYKKLLFLRKIERVLELPFKGGSMICTFRQELNYREGAIFSASIQLIALQGAALEESDWDHDWYVSSSQTADKRNRRPKTAISSL